MNNLINNVEQKLFLESDLSISHLQKSIDAMQARRIDFADIFLQECTLEYWQLEDGIVKDASFNLNKGVGVRCIDGEKTGFSYANLLRQNELSNAVNAAMSIKKSASDKIAAYTHSKNNFKNFSSLYSSSPSLEGVSAKQKVELLEQLDKQARNLSSSVHQVIASLSASHEHMMVLATDGTLAADIRPMIRLNVTVIIDVNGRRERGSAGLGGRYLWSELMQLDLSNLPKQAVEQAERNIIAIEAPAGTMPVILGNGWSGVLLHEAVGHGLEGDFNRKGSSAYSNKMGQKVASELCTIVDDGSLAACRGSLNVDDEGSVSRRNVLIENGILKGYMQDKYNAHLMGVEPTGNGRRESYAHLPLPRMTNTFMLSGESEPDEIIASVKRGIYAPNFAGGQVDITSGNFVFSANEAYLIEDGKISTPIKGATLIGNGPDVLKKVSMVANDSKLDPGVGVCGKAGQSVPVCVGQPTLKIDELTVGGTQA